MHPSLGIQVGDVIAGKYRVESLLGIGGMGVVVAARHCGLDQRVAIKFLQPMFAGHAQAVARFTREARATVRIKSEHVAKVFDVGELENGAPYMVMEHLEGSDLAQWLAEYGALPIQQAIEFVLQACEAVAEAHALGIVHRDLKPGNLFVVRTIDGAFSVKVLDFGISKLIDSMRLGEAGPVTRTAEFIGSPRYMSPEQMRSSKDVDFRSDVWSLGVILYELLAGTCPFAGDNLPDLALRVVQEAPASLREQRREVPVGIEQVIRRCLEKNPEQRYRTVRELALALSPFATKRAQTSIGRISALGEPTSGLAVTASPPAPPFSVGPHGTLGAPEATKKSLARRSLWFGGGATVLVLAVAVVVTQARSWRRDATALSSAGNAQLSSLEPGATASGPPSAALAVREIVAMPSPRDEAFPSSRSDRTASGALAPSSPRALPSAVRPSRPPRSANPVSSAGSRKDAAPAVSAKAPSGAPALAPSARSDIFRDRK